MTSLKSKTVIFTLYFQLLILNVMLGYSAINKGATLIAQRGQYEA